MINTRATLFAAACLALAGNALAECEFPYYPEYADRISQFDEVTPLLTKKLGMISHPWGVKPGAFICEPLLVRDIKSTPIFYALAFYKGDDVDVVKRWNEIVKKINAGSKTSASELSEEFKFFEDKDVRRLLSSSVVSAYTFGCGMIEGGGGTPESLRGYNAAYEKAAGVLNSRDLYFTRLIWGGYHFREVFEFEDRSGNKVAIVVDYVPQNEYPAAIADLGVIAADSEGLVKGWHEFIGEEPTRVEKHKDYWEIIQNKVPDDLAEQELARVPGENATQFE